MANKRRFLVDINSQDDLLSIKVSKRTLYAENSAVKALREYLMLTQPSIVLEELEISDLDEVLANFFPRYEKGNSITKEIRISPCDKASIGISKKIMENVGSI